MFRRIGVLLCIFLINQTHGNTKVNDFLFSGGLDFIDLSHPFDNDTIYWPGGRPFHFIKKYANTRPDGVWYSANEFCAAEHGGTHLDAPRHLGPDQWTVGQIPLDHLITPLIIVDLSSVVADDPEFLLQKHHMDHLFVGDTRRNFTVIFKFGWAKHYGNINKYFGTKLAKPNPDQLRFPGISEDVAKWLVENKNLVGVGVDTASVDAGQETALKAHSVFASHNIFMLENVNLKTDMPSNQCAIIVMPMKIQDGTGAPVRLTAICPRLSGHSLF